MIGCETAEKTEKVEKWGKEVFSGEKVSKILKLS